MQIPLMTSQLEIWISQVFDPRNPASSISDYYEVTGPVDADILARAIQLTCEEAGTIGHLFSVKRDGTPVQEPGTPDWKLEILDASDAPDPQAAAMTWMKGDLSRPLDITGRRLLTSALIKLADDKFIWYRRCHHIVVDGHSAILLAQRIAALYTAILNDDPFGPSPFGSILEAVADDRKYLASNGYQADREFWRKQLADWPTATHEPKASNSSAAAVNRRAGHHLANATADAIHERAMALGTSPPMFLITATALHLRQVTMSDEVTFGLSVAGRRTHRLRNVVAPMANIVPLRVPIDPQQTVTGTCQLIAGLVRRALRHHRYRYEEIQRELTESSPGAHIGPVVNILNFDGRLRLGNTDAVQHTLTTGAIPDIGFFFDASFHGDGLNIGVEANPTGYTDEEADGHADRLGRLVSSLAVADLSTTVRDLDHVR